MKAQNKQKIQPDWWTKTFAGLFLGFSFAAMMGCIVFLLSLPHVDRMLSPQLGMWTIPWVWMPMFFLAYIIPKGWQSVLIFSVANVIAFVCLFLIRA